MTHPLFNGERILSATLGNNLYLSYGIASLDVCGKKTVETI